MAVYLGDNLITGSGSSTLSGGGGGGFTDQVDFITSGIWTVPTHLSDIVADSGFVDIGLFTVGGGSAATALAGEVIDELYRLSANDYIDPLATIKQVRIDVGGAGGSSHFGGEQTGVIVASTFGSYSSQSSGSPPNSPAEAFQEWIPGASSLVTDDAGIPIITRVRYATTSGSYPGPNGGTGVFDQTFTAATQPTFPLILGPTLFSNPPQITSISTTGWRRLGHWISPDTYITVFTDIAVVSSDHVARPGDTVNAATLFRNNPESLDGYAGTGYARAGATGSPNSGAAQQSGFLRVYHN